MSTVSVITHQDVGKKVREWLDAKKQLEELQGLVKGLQDDILNDPAVATRMVIAGGGYVSLAGLGLPVAACAYKRASIVTDQKEFGRWLERQEDTIKMAVTQGKWQLNKRVYEALPAKQRRKLDKHVKHGRVAPYLVTLLGK